ncbi:MFS DHA1 sub-family [Cantharellus anzutake]|uniref:MFS DHA1 sub-family n=1 Tax=Cantharellus anzutake TaxID=1750568 RepID=UPI00190459C6|nr:MFS DHA1 sub-family [Cantharellus anzutake]KAF8339027.1 MFS DHA1 sub-family [Cantharellus anzutake]
MSARIQRVVFFALVIDLLAFTIPLPLFPRLIEWYTSREGKDVNGILYKSLSIVTRIRSWFLSDARGESVRKRWDIVLLGGLLGSLFSTLQYIISPALGTLSDKFGRKRILMLSMIGNLLSAIVWLQSTSFASFMLSRAIGGISEGNVQLSIAILSDITTPMARGRALSLVGIAFGICFCIGPPLGAYFASRPISTSLAGVELNIYAAPAALTLVLLSIETAFLAYFLPETKGRGPLADLDDIVDSNDVSPTLRKPKYSSTEVRLDTLQALKRYHFLFLSVFSGVEFTLMFLTFDLFDWNNLENGRLLGLIGVLSTVLQGGYVRRMIGKVGEIKMARRGVMSCIISLIILSRIPNLAKEPRTIPKAIRLLYLSAAFFAFTSATVVNALTSAASLQCDDGLEEDSIPTHPELRKGRALGKFRSSGQLGRAIGPLLACASYWSFGGSLQYDAIRRGLISL